MRVSIVIPALNAAKTLPRCLESLLRQDFQRQEREIIVVNNNSSDDTEKVIRSFPVIYAFETVRSAAAARNKGISLAKGEYVAFIDADCVADSVWLSNLMSGFTREEIGACGGSLRVYNPHTLMERYFCRTAGSSTVFIQEDLLFPSLFTGGCMYRRKALEEAGFFDTVFKADEDVDLSFMVFLKGYQVVNVPEAIVYHTYSPSVITHVKRWFTYGIYLPYLKKKYRHVFQHSGMNIRGIFEAVRGQLRHARSFLKALVSPWNALAIVTPVIASLRDVVMIAGSAVGVLRLFVSREKMSVVQNPDRLLYRQVDEKLIISNPRRDFYFILKGTGARIWLLLKERKSEEEIVSIMSDEYEVDPSFLRADIADLIVMMKKENIMPPSV